MKAKLVERAALLKSNLRKLKQQRDGRKLLQKENILTEVSMENFNMEKIKIIGGKPLKGTLKVQGAKNSALPLLIATILCDEEVVLENVPNLLDIETVFGILKELNVALEYKDGVAKINAAKVNNYTTSYDLASRMRASVLILGPLLAKHKRAIVPLPGGCTIGLRPVDIHQSALEKMGATITIEHGNIKASAENGLVGCDITFDKVSVGATENIMMAAVLAKGETRLINAAREPEIVDLANFLNKMGAKIEGAGNSLITIQGVKKLTSARHKVMPDRIQAGSYAIAAVATKGSIFLEDCTVDIFGEFEKKLVEAGAIVNQKNNGVEVSYGGKIEAVDVTTAPFPGFPTDLQAPWTVLMCIASGKSFVKENIFENRFSHVPELLRMGASIVQQDHTTALFSGINLLSAAEVKATDLRSAFALIIAGLVAEGETVITKLHHLDRGYSNAVEVLSYLGANIKRGVDI